MNICRLLLLAALPGLVSGTLLANPAPAATAAADRTRFIRTPPPPSSPRINGPRIFGARPGHPFFYHLPVTGERPFTITASGLPAGLTLDAATGNITGAVDKAGEFDAAFTATNAKGTDRTTLRIVIGDNICLTPPMGWNSWNYFNMRVTAGDIRAAADAMVATGMIDHGWTYVNLDDGWAGGRDDQGRILPKANFPDMKGMADYVHGKGLKFGIYTTPGPITCGHLPGSLGHEALDVASYAAWGVDYLKYDGCTITEISKIYTAEEYAKLLPESAAELIRLGKEAADLTLKFYNHIPGKKPGDKNRLNEISKRVDELHAAVPQEKRAQIAMEIAQRPWRQMRPILDAVERDIVYSISQGGRAEIWKWGGEIGANLWRVSTDIGASWKSVESHGFAQADDGLEKWAGPGRWNDPDMLEIGNGKLTPDECYTHMTMWCVLGAPLLIGCDMTKMDAFTTSLFCNDEVLAVNQDRLGRQGCRVRKDGEREVWTKPLADGSLAVALCNRGGTAAEVAVTWNDLKLTGPQVVRDLWRQKDIGELATGHAVMVAPHGAELFRIAQTQK